jgi:membrane protease YdiL (CAAX protease family)
LGAEERPESATGSGNLAPGNTGPEHTGPGYAGLALRLGVFFFLEYVGLSLFALVFNDLLPFFYASIFATFFSAVFANSYAVRIYERGRLEHVGMGWAAQSSRHFWMGVGVGLAAALAVTALPAAAGLAEWRTPVETAFDLTRMSAAGVGLLFGALAEELLFRGYGFQILLRRFNPWVVLGVFSAVFGWMHHWNPDATVLSDVNTALWGFVLGFAVLRSGALWMAIGLHFGWNFGLPMAGAKMSGFAVPIGPKVLAWKVGEVWSGGAYGPEGGLLCTAAALLTLLWLWKSPIQRQPGLLAEASE